MNAFPNKCTNLNLGSEIALESEFEADIKEHETHTSEGYERVRKCHLHPHGNISITNNHHRLSETFRIGITLEPTRTS